jgi:uncharacterized protein YlxP (DUF503 family)
VRVGVVTVALRIPESHSLKEKRRVVKALKDRLRSRFNVSVAEVDHQDLWQRATIGIVFVGSDGEPVVRTANLLRKQFEEEDRAELLDFTFESL